MNIQPESLNQNRTDKQTRKSLKMGHRPSIPLVCLPCRCTGALSSAGITDGPGNVRTLHNRAGIRKGVLPTSNTIPSLFTTILNQGQKSHNSRQRNTTELPMTSDTPRPVVCLYFSWRRQKATNFRLYFSWRRPKATNFRMFLFFRSSSSTARPQFSPSPSPATTNKAPLLSGTRDVKG